MTPVAPDTPSPGKEARTWLIHVDRGDETVSECHAPHAPHSKDIEIVPVVEQAALDALEQKLGIVQLGYIRLEGQLAAETQRADDLRAEVDEAGLSLAAAESALERVVDERDRLALRVEELRTSLRDCTEINLDVALAVLQGHNDAFNKERFDKLLADMEHGRELLKAKP